MTTTESQRLWISGTAAVIAVVLCWAFIFATHLSVLPLIILVPYIMPIVQSLDVISRVSVFITEPVIQFSFYGFILGRAWFRDRLRTTAIGLGALHVIAVIVCYLIITSHI